MMKGEQQKIFHKGSNRKINAFITLLYPSNNKVKFKINESRTSTDFIDHFKNIRLMTFLSLASQDNGQAY